MAGNDVWSLRVREGKFSRSDRHGEDQMGRLSVVDSWSRSWMESAIQTKETWAAWKVTLEALIRSVFPPPKGVRLVGVTLSNFQSQSGGEAAELPFS